MPDAAGPSTVSAKPVTPTAPSATSVPAAIAAPMAPVIPVLAAAPASTTPPHVVGPPPISTPLNAHLAPVNPVELDPPPLPETRTRSEVPINAESLVPQNPRGTEADLEPEPWWITPEPRKTPQDFALGAAGPHASTLASDESADVPEQMNDGNESSTTSVVEDLPATTVLQAEATMTNTPTEPAVPSRHAAPNGPARTATRTVIWVGAVLLAIIILVGLFLLGQNLASAGAPVPTATATPTPSATPTPTPTVKVTAAQPVGVHAWDTLFGGECLEPFESPWAETFTVSDCAAAHGAQLVYRGSFGGDATTVFPGEAALAAQMNLLCTAPGVLDLAAAGAYPDLQMQGSYPVTDEQWADPARHYYCFVSRSSAEPLTASIAGPGPAA
ncbi:hypothetical protein H4V99_000025 [Cryobacterium sp. CG_9.6]|nr:hypothetical protein [Cryobacterium sp. CG_9.6]